MESRAAVLAGVVSTPTADALWDNDRSLADACLRHPFVRGLADGSLPGWRYRDYLAQDAFFLRAFGEAYRLAEGQATDDAIRPLYRELCEGITEELELHGAMAARLGIDLGTVKPGEATLAYTEFLLATAATRPEPYTAAAMLPCLRLYAWLGQQLLPDLNPESPWADWVRTYADPGFDDLWRKLAPRLEAAPRADLAPLHTRAMELEYRFFDAAWRGPLREGRTTVSSETPPLALTIAGSDPSGGAGIQADLKTFHRCGVYGQSVITLLTAQNTRGVTRVHLEPVDVIRDQLTSVLDDLGTQAVKTGALGSPQAVSAVAAILRQRHVHNLVVDPVLISKHGHELAPPDVALSMTRELLPLASLVTPNCFEAERLTNVAITDLDSAERAAEALLEAGAKAALIKKVPGLDTTGDGRDLLKTPKGTELYTGPAIETTHLHGSGCTYSAAITACLAQGFALPAAVTHARDFIVRAIASAPGLGQVGPVNHWA